MLNQLIVKDFALIEQLALEIHDGLIVFTGETGAGKSIIMDALALALGKRGETSSIREGCDKCEVSAVFDIKHNRRAQSFLATYELSQENETDCILRRIITRDGRSKSFINGKPVILQQLKELGLCLVTIHGQHEYQHLLASEGQQSVLDHAGQLGSLRKQLHLCYQQYRQISEEIENKQTAHQQLIAQQDFLNFQLQELLELDLKEGELEELEREQKKLAHSQELISGLQTILSALDEDDQSVTHQLRITTTKLSQLSHYDNKLTTINDLLNSAQIQLQESINEINHSLEEIDLDPTRLTELENRLGRAFALARKHHITPNELITLQSTLSTKLASFDNNQQALSILQLKQAEVSNEYHRIATELSCERHKAVDKLTTAISQYMQQLGMKGGKFSAQLTPLDRSTPCPSGYEKVEFLVSTNPGSSLQPLSKIVSGGELSRLSLALVVISSKKDAKITLIFDEIDAGIGGATAACVGDLLKTLSIDQQILCITHAAQVASRGNQHFYIQKKIKRNKTEVVINELTEQERIQEIARMVSGTHISSSTLAHAKEMLNTH